MTFLLILAGPERRSSRARHAKVISQDLTLPSLVEKRELEKKRRSYEPCQSEDIEKFLREEATLKIS